MSANNLLFVFLSNFLVIFLSSSIILDCYAQFSPKSETYQKKDLYIHHHKFLVEVADNPLKLQNGLKFRYELDKYSGMLFDVRSIKGSCFYMKDVFIALTFAFIDTDGIIQKFEDALPNSLDNHCAIFNTSYVIAMNRGWFVSNHINKGDFVNKLILTKGIPEWFGDPDNNCYGFFEPISNDPISFFGQCKKGAAEGLGRIIQWKNGQSMTITTYFNLGKINGLGYIEYSNGDTYFGNFKDSVFSGKGIFKYGNEEIVLEGIWINGEFEYFDYNIKLPENKFISISNFEIMNQNNQSSNSLIDKREKFRNDKCKRLGLTINSNDFKLCLNS